MRSIEDAILYPNAGEIANPVLRVISLSRALLAIEELNDSLHWNDLEMTIDSDLLRRGYLELWALQGVRNEQ